MVTVGLPTSKAAKLIEESRRGSAIDEEIVKLAKRVVVSDTYYTQKNVVERAYMGLELAEQLLEWFGMLPMSAREESEICNELLIDRATHEREIDEVRNGSPAKK